MGMRPYNDRWNANLYDEKHSFVSIYGEDLIQLLDPKEGEHILDLGCGTGDIAKKIYDMGAKVKAVDRSENMIHQAQDKYPHIEFEVQDATKLNDKNEFDAVFSNATLHWIKTPERALSSIYGSLKNRGRFVAEFGGKGNVQVITNAIKEEASNIGVTYEESLFPWYFPSVAEYTTLMEKTGFTVVYAHLFDRPTPLKGPEGLRNWLKMFGKMMFDELDSKTFEQLIIHIENHLKEKIFEEDAWVADYKRLRVIGIKA